MSEGDKKSILMDNSIIRQNCVFLAWQYSVIAFQITLSCSCLQITRLSQTMSKYVSYDKIFISCISYDDMIDFTFFYEEERDTEAARYIGSMPIPTVSVLKHLSGYSETFKEKSRVDSWNLQGTILVTPTAFWIRIEVGVTTSAWKIDSAKQPQSKHQEIMACAPFWKIHKNYSL